MTSKKKPSLGVELGTVYDPNGPLLAHFAALIHEFDEIAATPDPYIDELLMKHVYACAGICLYHAHCFEGALCGLLLSESRASGTVVTAEQWEVMDSELDKLTCGQLIAKLKSRVRIDGNGQTLLGRALHLRNDIAHHFFYRHGAAILNRTGRRTIVAELARNAQLLHYAGGFTHQITYRIYRLCGISEDVLEDLVRQQTEELRKNWKATGQDEMLSTLGMATEQVLAEIKASTQVRKNTDYYHTG